MPPKVSAAEKRSRLLKCFHTANAPLTGKEVEKAGAKAGINTQIIKDGAWYIARSPAEGRASRGHPVAPGQHVPAVASSLVT